MQMSLENVIQGYLSRRSLFKDRKPFNGYTPDEILHRDREIETAASILSPALKNQRPSNLFVYGKPGTGKTTVINRVAGEIQRLSENHNTTVKMAYLNCKLKNAADTEYRVIASLCKAFGRDVPATGLPTVKIYDAFFDALEEAGGTTIIVLDEVDFLVAKIGDGFLYNLTRINDDLKKARVSIIGISNNLSFTGALDPRVRSSLSEEELLFPPYNALQLRDILKTRASMAFNEDALEEGVIEKCAALAAQEHGDARRALDLLRVAGEIAEREGAERVRISHVDVAQGKLDEDRVLDAIRAQPRQSQTVLWTVMQNSDASTGNVYALYETACKNNGLKPLTQRRVSDLISELDVLGVVETRVVSKGRYGRTRIIQARIPPHLQAHVRDVLVKEFFFA
ncbi:MAG: orc1/cdc6 family replication initiation protein [Candidatus Aenigmatarchaeota archaeon]|nr:MAG: orc1/cdc6 family replication initiation protein [Candidatus Aenigmarchaeota archaeon]